jgi:hypothetical protein
MASRFEDDSVFDDQGVLRPGAVARVKMMARDSALPPEHPLTQDELMARYIQYETERRRDLHVDALNDAPFALNRPGFRVLKGGTREQQRDIDAARQKVIDAYEEVARRNSEAWRAPPPSASSTTGTHEFSSEPRPGSPCTKDGCPGVWEMDEQTGELCCRIDRRATGSTDGRSLAQLIKDHNDVMGPVYEAYARELSEAWKTK